MRPREKKEFLTRSSRVATGLGSRARGRNDSGAPLTRTRTPSPPPAHPPDPPPSCWVETPAAATRPQPNPTSTSARVRRPTSGASRPLRRVSVGLSTPPPRLLAHDALCLRRGAPPAGAACGPACRTGSNTRRTVPEARCPACRAAKFGANQPIPLPNARPGDQWEGRGGEGRGRGRGREGE